MSGKSRAAIVTAAALAALGLGTSQHAKAQTTWNSTTTAWGDGANWSPTTVPDINTAIVFDAVGSMAIDLGGVTRDLKNLTFNSTAQTYTFSGNAVDKLNFNSGGFITVNGNSQTFNSVIGLNGSFTITNNGAGLVTLNNTISLTGGSPGTFIVNGTGNTAINGGIATNGISNFTKSGTGSVTFGSANIYTGTTTVANGMLTTLSNVDGALGAGDLVFGSATSPTSTTGVLNLGGNEVLASMTVGTNNATANQLNIGSGKTLLINGAFTVGVINSTNQAANFTATGGTLAIDNNTADVNLGVNNSNGATGSSSATVDLSALAAFTANVNSFNVSKGTGSGRIFGGSTKLSNTTNTITANSMAVGDTGGGANNGSGGDPTLILGTGINTINTDTLVLGQGKARGNITFTSHSAGSPGSLTLAGKTGSKVNITLGNNNVNGGTNPGGVMDLTGHTANVTAGVLTMASSSTSSGAGGASGELDFDAGNFTVDTITMAAKTGAAAVGATAQINVGGGNFTVNSGGAFTMGSQSSAGTSSATLNITGGVFTSNVNITRGSGSVTSTIITDTGSTLNMTGHAIGTSNAISSLDFKGGTVSNVTTVNTSTLKLGTNSSVNLGIQLAGNPGTAPIIAPSFAVSNTNVINISSSAPLSIGSFGLIDYSGSIGGATGFAGLTLGTLPSRVVANLVNNTGATRVDVNITAFDSIRWIGNVNGTWDINTTSNWKTVIGNAATTYLQPTAPGDSVLFDDNAVGNFNVATSVVVSPASITFNNNANDYSLGGAGITATGLSVTGSRNVTVSSGNFSVASAFTKNGAGSFTFSNSGAVLTLPGTIVLNSGVLAVNRSDNLSISNALTGSGTFRKDNTNTLTLGGSNAGFNGTIQVASGTLKVGSTDALGSVTAMTTVSSGATLDLNSVMLNNGNVTINGTGIGGNGALTNSGSGAAQILSLTLGSDATIGSTAGAFVVASTGASVHGNSHDITTVGTAEYDFINVGDTGLANINISSGQLYLGGNSTAGSPAGVITVSGGNSQFGFYGNLDTNASTAAITKPIAIPSAVLGGIAVFNGNKTIDSTTITIGATGLLDISTYPRSNNTTSTATITGKVTGLGGLSVHCAANTSISRLGMVELTSNLNDYSGSTVIGGGSTVSGASAANDRITLSVGNGGSTGTLGTGDVTVNSLGTLRFNRNNSLAVTNKIIGNGGVTQFGSGVTTLTGSNSYTGNMTLLGGTLVKGGANALPVGPVVFGDLSNATGGLDLGTYSQTITSLTVQSNSATFNTLTIGSGKTLTVTGPVTVGSIVDGQTANIAVNGPGTFR